MQPYKSYELQSLIKSTPFCSRENFKGHDCQLDWIIACKHEKQISCVNVMWTNSSKAAA